MRSVHLGAKTAVALLALLAMACQAGAQEDIISRQ